ncbi:MAG: DUF805 domain-containing protein [Desulfovibrio sp.]|jgi:uncharacterized membrane protein YhaH (DUF805 family)|nr:DUF805 domain-containing protein [Desulfovibrio sp.]
MAKKQKDALLIRALVGMLSLRGKMDRGEFLVALPFLFMVGTVCFLYIVANLVEGNRSLLLFLAYGLFAIIAAIAQAKRLRDIGLPGLPAWIAGFAPFLFPLIISNLSPENPLRQIFWEAVLLAWIVFLAAAPSRHTPEEDDEEEENPPAPENKTARDNEPAARPDERGDG